MITSPDVLYDIHRKPSPWPGVVREPIGDRAANDAIPAGARASIGVVARDVGSAQSPSDAVSAPSRSEAGKPDDDLARLGDRIAELAAGINAAEAQMMTLIADFDRRGGWKDGFGSCAEWLAWKIGIKIGPARERVRAARALENLPRDAELTAEQARHRSRAFSVFVDGDGMPDAGGEARQPASVVAMIPGRSRSSAGRTPWGCSRSGRWRRGSGAVSRVAPATGRIRICGRRLDPAPNPAPAPSATRSWSTAMPRRCGKMLADAPKQVWRDLAPVPSVHPAAPPTGGQAVLSNGAALYRDSDIPWRIEADAREAVEESLE